MFLDGFSRALEGLRVWGCDFATSKAGFRVFRVEVYTLGQGFAVSLRAIPLHEGIYPR